MLPFISVRNDIEEEKLKVLEVYSPSENVSIQLLYHKNKWLSQSMQAWIDITQKNMGTLIISIKWGLAGFLISSVTITDGKWK